MELLQRQRVANSGLQAYLNQADLQNGGFTTSTLIVTSTVSDTTPPVLVALSFNPTTVNVANGPAAVAVQAHVTDNLSDVNFVAVTFAPPPGGTSNVAAILIRTSGDAYDGTYAGTLTLPQSSVLGTWSVLTVELLDNVFNQALLTTADLQNQGFTTQLTVS